MHSAIACRGLGAAGNPSPQADNSEAANRVLDALEARTRALAPPEAPP